MLRKQSGVTTNEVIVLAVLMIGIGVLFFTAIPLVTEYVKVKNLMESMAVLPEKEMSSESKIIMNFIRRAGVHDMYRFEHSALEQDEELVVIGTKGKTDIKTLTVTYERTKKLAWKFYLTLRVKETIELGTGQTETVSLPWEGE